MKPRHLNSGEAAEELALHWLKARGLRLITRNYRCRSGEIDLIMQEGESLVFVEVRYRCRADFGSAAETVDSTKQHRLRLAAEHYLQRQRSIPPCRFDIIGIDERKRIDWIRNAF
jgi:putative endonuclease